MIFRTEITPAPLDRRIDHGRRGLSVGSCFAASMADKLRRYKFPVVSNPTGVLYNPASIADLLESAFNAAAAPSTADAIATDISAADAPNAAAAPATDALATTDAPNAALATAGTSNAAAAPNVTAALAAADYVLVTFGTAWVYEEGGRVVANCGRRPAHLFTRRRMGVEEIAERYRGLMRGALADKQVVLTVSPIRHLRDRAEENSLSKATLRLAIARIVEEHPDRAHYFPAYELLMDDLRDYRFYGRDMTHPSVEAVDYIWEKFAEAALTPAARELLPEIERIVRAAEHRPFDPATEEHAAFRRAMLDRTRALATRHPNIDLNTEIEFFI